MNDVNQPLQYAGVRKRFSAQVIDALVLLPTFGLAYWIAQQYKPLALIEPVLTLIFGLWFNVYLVKRYGGTPGKVLLGLQIVRVDGLPVDYRQAALRYSVAFVLGIAIAAGNVGLLGSTGSVLDRSLVGLRGLIDRSLAEVRVGPGMSLHRSVFSLANFIGEVKYAAALEAKLLNCSLHVEEISSTLMIDADKDLLFSALGNLLQNAFKFSGRDGVVTLSVDAGADRIRLKVKDSGPGLSPEAARDMFLPFTQSGSNKSGLGLGLSIARRSVEANGGSLTVESKLGHGCLFTIDLPMPAIVA